MILLLRGETDTPVSQNVRRIPPSHVAIQARVGRVVKCQNDGAGPIRDPVVLVLLLALDPLLTCSRRGVVAASWTSASSCVALGARARVALGTLSGIARGARTCVANRTTRETAVSLERIAHACVPPRPTPSARPAAAVSAIVVVVTVIVVTVIDATVVRRSRSARARATRARATRARIIAARIADAAAVQRAARARR
jgi:hypothetical protein